ncbi:MAG: Sir2 family NAD-dependent protein deacetylase [Casimicrobiaceae bacterium]
MAVPTELAKALSAAQLNAVRFAPAAWERRAAQILLMTQNVDELHQRAGSAQLVALHGNIGRVKCSREGTVVAGL